ncbi:hypothetical protein EG329_013656 [Mollisiaceae sp. DMI_Dod_QoI]|nr:hypothetical protein EG329_013656 [Helotiales sp. DMI_Dod_QoI]
MAEDRQVTIRRSEQKHPTASHDRVKQPEPHVSSNIATTPSSRSARGPALTPAPGQVASHPQSDQFPGFNTRTANGHVAAPPQGPPQPSRNDNQGGRTSPILRGRLHLPGDRPRDFAIGQRGRIDNQEVRNRPQQRAVPDPVRDPELNSLKKLTEREEEGETGTKQALGDKQVEENEYT